MPIKCLLDKWIWKFRQFPPLLELVILVYLSMSVDVVVSAYGILNGWGSEANVLIGSLSDPVHQIVCMLGIAIFGSWGIFGTLFLPERYRVPFFGCIVNVLMISASINHLYGASTWLMLP